MSDGVFNPRMLILARKGCGKTQAALSYETGVSQAFLSKIENGLESANVATVERLAAACDVPAPFLFQDGQVLGEGLIDFFHRKRMTLPAKPLERAHANANMIRLETGHLLRSLALTDVAPLPQVPHGEDLDAEEAAELARATWRLPPGPIPDLTALIEAAGVPVFRVSLGHEKLSAISMPGETNGSHLIVLNSDLPASAQRFTLAHELGHLTMHFSNTPPPDLEDQANRFASALLMPRRDIAPELRGVQFRDLGALKRRWRTSMAALIRSARDTGNISDREYRTFNIKLGQLPGGRKREPGEFAAEEPHLIRHVLDYYRTSLGYSFENICELMRANSVRVSALYLGEPIRTMKAVDRPARSLSIAR